MIVWGAACIGGIDLNSFCRQTKISLPQTTRNTIEHRVHNAAYEIIQGRGATWDGIAGAVADLIRCIANDERRILTVSVVDGAGEKSLSMSLPRIVGRAGVVATLMPKMDASESAALRRSGRIIRKNFDLL
jgi:L-lactate dehydrogenase